VSVASNGNLFWKRNAFENSKLISQKAISNTVWIESWSKFVPYFFLAKTSSFIID
jgi:hypothetical protein